MQFQQPKELASCVDLLVINLGDSPDFPKVFHHRDVGLKYLASQNQMCCAIGDATPHLNLDKFETRQLLTRNQLREEVGDDV